MSGQSFFNILASLTLLSPLALLVYTGVISAFDNHGNREREISFAAMIAIAVGLFASIGITLYMLATDRTALVFDLGDWMAIDEAAFHFHLTFVYDRLSIPFLILIYILCGTVGSFSTRYLHREPGFRRFFLLYSVFTLGMVLSALAGTIEVLFFGWELVGLSSALLIGFFHERQAPVVNGLRVWAVYRISDAAFLIAAVMLHHLTGEGNLQRMMGVAAWPDVETTLTANQALAVGLLLVLAAAGKSGLVPFSGWLPRAMEGPTNSSAIFYGALSVHLGAYLLLRVSPVIAASTTLSVLVVGLGLTTAVYASLVERVQSDIKSALAFASLTQVGLIVAEIGMGWQYLALVHLLGHAVMRTLQMLRAPSLLRDYFNLESALGRRIAYSAPAIGSSRFPRLRNAIYRFAWERGYFDSLINSLVVRPVLSFFGKLAKLESAWIAYWGGEAGSQRSEVRDQKSDVGDQKSDVGDQRSEVGNQMLEVGGQNRNG